MDYMGWKLSIYDECINRYNEKYIRKLTNKETLKKMFSKKYLFETASVIMTMIYAIGVMVIMFLYFLGIIEKMENYLLYGALVLLISYIPQIYKYESKLDDFKKKLSVLSEVLGEEGLDTIESIEELAKDTEGVLDKIKGFSLELTNKYILTISGLFAAIGIKNVNIEDKTIQNFTMIFVIVLILSVFIAWIWYLLLTMIPNNRVVRRRKFHELLKILLMYKKANSERNENINTD